MRFPPELRGETDPRLPDTCDTTEIMVSWSISSSTYRSGAGASSSLNILLRGIGSVALGVPKVVACYEASGEAWSGASGVSACSPCSWRALGVLRYVGGICESFSRRTVVCINVGDCSFLQVGSICRKIFLLDSVNLRPPSTILLYWRCGRHSTINPFAYHFLGLLPVLFLTCTASPIFNSSRTLSVSLGSSLSCRFANALSLASFTICHSWRMLSICRGRWFLIDLP